MAEQCAEEREKKRRGEDLRRMPLFMLSFRPSTNLFASTTAPPPPPSTAASEPQQLQQHPASKATMPIAARRPAHNPRRRDTSGPITPARRRLKNGKQPSICPARIPTPSLADYPSTPSCRTNRPPRPVVLRPKSAAARQHVAHSLSQRGSPSARG
ncbi:hypothetical protein Purlil1_4666 [Purpureocillium lilacinum]|uniref:Uncharacterized protein n=1 Tax=Purpureocillium lilacinum TaxID=33203 RepID=A0ABR0C4S2_PURLI|nr:hypothetical protein Purlil1_4666 [Purpureocillium lilacinum]